MANSETAYLYPTHRSFIPGSLHSVRDLSAHYTGGCQTKRKSIFRLGCVNRLSWRAGKNVQGPLPSNTHFAPLVLFLPAEGLRAFDHARFLLLRTAWTPAQSQPHRRERYGAPIRIESHRGQTGHYSRHSQIAWRTRMSVCWRTRLQEHQQKSYNVWKHGKQLGEVCSGLRGDCLKFLEQLVHVEYCGFDLLTVLQASAISECGGQQFDASKNRGPLVSHRKSKHLWWHLSAYGSFLIKEGEFSQRITAYDESTRLLLRKWKVRVL